MRSALLCLVIAVFSAFTSIYAQESRATLTGTVLDPQGSAIPGATVSAKNNGTGIEAKTTTNEAGLYVVPFLNTGSYTVTISAAGFKTAVDSNVQLGISERRQLDFSLQIGAISEQVSVSATAELLNTANAVRSTTLTQSRSQTFRSWVRTHTHSRITHWVSPTSILREALQTVHMTTAAWMQSM